MVGGSVAVAIIVVTGETLGGGLLYSFTVTRAAWRLALSMPDLCLSSLYQ